MAVLRDTTSDKVELHNDTSGCPAAMIPFPCDLQVQVMALKNGFYSYKEVAGVTMRHCAWKEAKVPLGLPKAGLLQ